MGSSPINDRENCSRKNIKAPHSRIEHRAMIAPSLSPLSPLISQASGPISLTKITAPNASESAKIINDMVNQPNRVLLKDSYSVVIGKNSNQVNCDRAANSPKSSFRLSQPACKHCGADYRHESRRPDKCPPSPCSSLSTSTKTKNRPPPIGSLGTDKPDSAQPCAYKANAQYRNQ